MELDDLKDAWHRMEQRLDTTGDLSLRLYRESRIDRIRGVMRRMMAGQAFQLLVWIGVTALVAPFWIEHRHTPHLLAFGLMLHAYAVLTIVSSVVQLSLMVRIDYAAPVLVLQRQLVQLRALRIRNTLLLILPWWLLWIAGFVVGVKLWRGLDVAVAAPAFVATNFLFGFVGMAATLWYARRIARRAAQTGQPARFADDLAGHSLRRAIGELDELARFGRE